MLATSRAVTVIQPTITRLPSNITSINATKRVAAYARVSTDTEEQLSSYEAQIDYYTRFINEKAGWDLVEIYTDEGISATNTKKRDGFKRMIADAIDGKIDMIITKSVSRFARNTVDTLTTVRQLKEKGVEVYFEKENIYTMDSKGELLITIMSSLAQEESRSISENVTWGQRKRFQDGKVSLPYKRFLGYEKGPDGLPKVVEEQATIVRLIYRLFLDGMTAHGIAKYLTSKGIPTPSGKQRWQSSTVESILTNEKYKGDALLQKCFTVNFLTKKQKVNEGEVPQYYVENSHSAIISPEVHDLVQAEMKKRKALGQRYSTMGTFASKLICGDCGNFYGSKVWHSTDRYRRVIWQCNYKFKNKAKCTSPHLEEEAIKTAFVTAFNSIIDNKDAIIAGFDAIMEVLTDTTAIDAESHALQEECEVIMELIKKCVDENACTVLDQGDYERRYNALIERYEVAKERLNELSNIRQERMTKHQDMSQFLETLMHTGNLITEFDENLWNAMVESVTVYSRERLVFRFKNDTEITQGV